MSTEDWYLYNSDQSGNNPVYDFVIKKAPTVQSLSGSGFTVSDGGTELPLEPCVAQNLGTETTNGWEICSTASGTFTAVPSSWSNSKNGHYLHYYSTNECGTATSSNLQLEVMSSSALTAANTTIDCGGTASLSAGGFTDATYKWYSDEACTREVHTGASYSPTGLTETTTYYVKASKSQVVQDGTASPTFTYRGSEDTYSVPENVYKAKLEVWGAQG
ncbi:MAG: hypothetical protein II575_06750, partial [Bacteroidales bacterium]|nr:hypothetical protein [Bacteroidales bacterium]